MAPKTKRTSAKRTTAKRSTAKTKTSSAKAKATSNGSAEAAKKAEEKRVARETQEAQQQATVVKRVVNGDESLSAVAKDLKITSGKAAFLIMKHRVANGEVPKITGKNDEALLRAVNTARLKADDHSSWGWLAARSGKSEGFIKSGLEGLGLYSPRAENIASKRAASKPKAAPKAKTSGGKTGKKKVKGNA